MVLYIFHSCRETRSMSFSIFILSVDRGTPFNIHIVVGLIESYFVVDRAEKPPNKSLSWLI